MDLIRQLELNLLRLAAERERSPGVDQTAWIGQVAELYTLCGLLPENYSSGRTVVNQADKCPRTSVRSPDTFLELDCNISSDDQIPSPKVSG